LPKAGRVFYFDSSRGKYSLAYRYALTIRKMKRGKEFCQRIVRSMAPGGAIEALKVTSSSLVPPTI
jgi:hypothetical protein